MDLLFYVGLGLSAGIVLGGALAPLRRRRQQRRGQTRGWHRAARMNRGILRFLSSAVYAALGVGLVWTLYFLVVGLVDRSQTEFAEQAASLIVAVLTLFSIMIAYFEFMHRGERKAEREAEAKAGPEGQTQPTAEEPDKTDSTL